MFYVSIMKGSQDNDLHVVARTVCKLTSVYMASIISGQIHFLLSQSFLDLICYYQVCGK